MKKTSIFGITILVLGVLLALMPQILLPVCAKGLELANGNTVPMACHWTGIFSTVLGVLIALAGVLMLVFREAQTQQALGIFSAALALTTILIATCIVGVCKNAVMPCHMGTQPGVIVVSILTIVCSILQIAASMKAKKARP